MKKDEMNKKKHQYLTNHNNGKKHKGERQTFILSLLSR